MVHKYYCACASTRTHVMRRARRAGALLAAGLLMATSMIDVRAQQPIVAATTAALVSPLDSLVAHAQDVNPRIKAAEHAIDAARARIAPAATLPDPMLALGIMNLPVSDPGFSDFMTMKTAGIGQKLPFPGKLGLARRAVELELEAASARLAAIRLEVAAEVKAAYYELAFLDRALEVLENNQTLLVNFVHTTESRYAVGAGAQQDVLEARVATARLAEDAVAVTEQRRAALARLNSLLDRPSMSPLEAPPRVPERIARAAVPDDAARVRFSSAALGARAADSPLPPLAELQQQALESSPELRVHRAEIGAQAARVELAHKAHLPDFDLSVQYGERSNRSDMLSVMVSVPIPVHRAARQDANVAESRADLASLEASHHAMVNRLFADVAEQYARLERDRAQLALFVTSILPQGRASLESAVAAFQVGRADFLTLLESQTTVFNYETAYFRALSDFATSLAELERIVGREVLP